MACPDENRLLQLAMGELSGDEAVAMQEHLGQCPSCREVVAYIVPKSVEESADAEFGFVEPGTLDDSLGPTGVAMGRYQVLRTLGSGANGKVFLARDPHLDRPVALKVLHDAARGAATARRVERLLQEAKALAKMDHPNVVAVYDVGYTASRELFIAMEYVEGTTLRGYLAAATGWRKTVEAFIDAAHGLAAAHEVGIVHRDFKPDNVLVRRDGRVKVGDFGLARLVGTIEPSSEDVQDERVLDERLTSSGALVGTPAYMAPEQFDGGQVGPHTDQFSFCVALFHALYGHRPFEGRTLAELAANVVEGRIRSVSRSAGVPAWLHRVVVRGLSARPCERWPNMAVLVQQLRPGRPWKTIALASAVAITGAGWAYAAAGEASTHCETAVDRMDSSWSQERRATARGGLRAGDEFGSRTLDLVEARLDTYVASWRAAQRSVCSASQTGLDFTDARQRCLDRSLAAVATTADLLADRGAVDAEDLMGLVSSLPDVDECLVLAEETTTRADEDVDRLVVLEAKLQRLAVLGTTTRADEALAELEALRTKEDLPNALLPQVGYRRGSLLAKTGDVDAAREELQDAYAKALEQNQDLVAADIALKLARVLSSSDPAGAEAWANNAEAWLQRTGQESSTRAVELLRSRGFLAQDKGDSDAAIELHERSVALARELDDDFQVAASLGNLGGALFAAGRFDRAREALQESAELDERLYGPGHPSVASVYVNLAALSSSQGRHTEAETHARRALSQLESAFGKDDPRAFKALVELGTVLTQAQKLDEAKTVLERAKALREASLPENDRYASAPDLALANIALWTGKLEVAARHYHSGLELMRRRLGPRHTDIGRYSMNLGMVYDQLKQPKRAQEIYAEAVDILREGLGPHHADLAHGLTVYAESLYYDGQVERALELLEDANTIRLGNQGDALFAARTKYLLAQALWDSGGDRRRARTEMEEALALLSGAEAAPDDNGIQSMKEWLASHRL